MKQIIKAILAIATLIFLIGVTGGNDLEMNGVPQVCRDYQGEVTCYRP